MDIRTAGGQIADILQDPVRQRLQHPFGAALAPAAGNSGAEAGKSKADRGRAEAFAGMAADAKGLEVLQSASRAAGLPKATGFVASDGSEYEPYRRFYVTAPPQLR